MIFRSQQDLSQWNLVCCSLRCWHLALCSHLRRIMHSTSLELWPELDKIVFYLRSSSLWPSTMLSDEHHALGKAFNILTKTILATWIFAHDIALLEEDKMKLQEVMTALDEETTKIVLRISAMKSKIMYYVSSIAQIWRITFGWQRLDELERFTYLNSVIAWNGDAETDVKCRIGKVTEDE